MNHDDNFTIIDSKLNSSKSDRTLGDTLESKIWRDNHGVDAKLAIKASNKSKQHIDKQTQFVKAEYYTKNIVKDGTKQGLHSTKSIMFGKAIAIIFIEVINETIDIFKNGFKKGNQDTFFDTIKIRFTNVKERIWNKLLSLDLLTDGVLGIISGFLSTLVTTLINIFINTTKKIVELLKTAIFSLVSAFKIMLDSSKSLNARLHEVSKILLSSMAISAIVSIDILFCKGLPDWATTPITTLMGGILTILISWVLDKLDIFNAKKSEIEEIRFQVLKTLQHQNLKQIDDLNSQIAHITFQYRG